MALALMESPQPPPLSVVLTALINDLAAAPQPVALVLDDYHLIGAPAVHEALGFLLDHLPPALHLVIASREDLAAAAVPGCAGAASSPSCAPPICASSRARSPRS